MPNQIPTIEEIERERARRSLIDFTEYTFPGYRTNWHHKLIASWLDDVARFERKRVIITTPPRRGKSELVSRRFPAYALGRWPDAEVIACSYGADLARSMSRDVQRIIDSEPYRELFPDTRLNSKHVVHDSDEKYKRTADEFEIVGQSGAYICRGVGGGITGHGANYIIVDDPIKNREQANSETFRDKLWNWYNDDLLTRLERPGAVIIMMTRWHEDDLIGRLLDREPEEWDVLHLPEVQDSPDDDRDYDPRDEGEPLWPAWYLAEDEQVDPDSEVPEYVDLDDLEPDEDADDSADGPAPEADAGEVEFIDYSELEDRAVDAFESKAARTRLSLYQGRPTSEDGEMFEREWIRRYTAPPERVSVDQIMISVDCAFKDEDTSDYVVLQVWGRNGARKYLLDQTRDKMGITETRDALEDLDAKWNADVKLIETKANGDALIQLLRGKVPGLVGFNPEAGKTERAQVAAWAYEAGDVLLPKARHASFDVGAYIEELTSFPNAKHDDQVDATSQAIIKWQKSTENPKENLKRILGR